MTLSSHARINQAKLIHLSIKMTTPHQSGAPFVGEPVFQNQGVCRQAFPPFPSPTPFLPSFCSRPIFCAARMRKTPSRGPNFVRFVRERLLRRLYYVHLFILNIFQVNPPFKSYRSLIQVSVVVKMMLFVIVPKFLCYTCTRF